MIINRNNAINAACIGGCVYWIILFLSLFFDIVTHADPEDGTLILVLIFSTFIGAAFYSMIVWTLLKPVEVQVPSKHWTWADAILGFSPLPIILFLAAVMILKVATD